MQFDNSSELALRRRVGEVGPLSMLWCKTAAGDLKKLSGEALVELMQGAITELRSRLAKTSDRSRVSKRSALVLVSKSIFLQARHRKVERHWRSRGRADSGAGGVIARSQKPLVLRSSPSTMRARWASKRASVTIRQWSRFRPARCRRDAWPICNTQPEDRWQSIWPGFDSIELTNLLRQNLRL